MALHSCVQIILVLLGQGITNKHIVCGTPRVGHGLHQFGAKASFEAFYLFFLCIDEPWGVLGPIVEGMYVLSEGLSPLSKSHELGGFHAH